MDDNKKIKFLTLKDVKEKLRNRKVVFEKDNFWEVFKKLGNEENKNKE